FPLFLPSFPHDALPILIVRYVMPLAHRLFGQIPRQVGWVLLVVLGSLFVADFLVTAIGLIGLNRKLKNLEYVTSKLRQGSNKLRSEEHTSELQSRFDLV